MSKYYSICHECRKIVCRSLSELGDDQQYCPSCKNKTDIVVDHPKLGNLDMLFFSIEAELVYFSTGRITSTLNGKFKIDLPLLRFKDNEENFISKNLYLWNTRISSTTDEIRDVFCRTTETIFDTEREAEKALNLYNTWMKISIGRVFTMLTIKNDAKSRYIHNAATHIPIRESDRKKAYYCPSCGNIGIVTVETGIGEYMTRENIKFTKPVAISEVYVYNNIRCIGCNEYMADIDFDIAERIEALNNLGIKTIYCCQGHVNREIVLDAESDANRSEEFNIDCPYITVYGNKYDNEELIDIAYDIVNDPKYTHLRIQFVDENHCETDEYTRIYVSGNVNGIDENELDGAQKEFMSFLDELIDQYKRLN